MNEAADLRPRPPRGVAGVGRVLLWQGCSLWIGDAAGGGNAHAHHAIQVCIALSGRVRFRIPDGSWQPFTAAIVRPHQRHQFDGQGASVAQIFVEPASAAGRGLLARRSDAPITSLDAVLPASAATRLRQAHDAHAADEQLVALVNETIGGLSGEAPAGLVDERVDRAIRWMRERLHEPIRLTQAARVAHLSPGRFRHLFVAQTGTSFRAYMLWARVSSAVGAAMSGLSWTEAAQTFGFADSAHLSRTCRRMFGIAPSMLQRQLKR